MLKIATIAAVFLPISALAQQQNAGMSAMLGTLSVRAEPMLQSGKLQGCSLVFNALTQDWKYRGGAFLKIEGPVLLSITENGAGAMLKVVANEIKTAQGGGVTFAASAPSCAYIISGDYKTNLDTLSTKGPAETAGGLLSVFELFPTAEMVLQATTDKKLTIAFNQNGGNSDLILPIDLNVSDIDGSGRRVLGSKASDEFSECMISLIRSNKATKTGRTAPSK